MGEEEEAGARLFTLGLPLMLLFLLFVMVLALLLLLLMGVVVLLLVILPAAAGLSIAPPAPPPSSTAMAAWKMLNIHTRYTHTKSLPDAGTDPWNMLPTRMARKLTKHTHTTKQ